MEHEQLDKYELLEQLGKGGMGEVWKARDTNLRRYVAIKLLHADLQANPDFVAHFMREAQLVASLRHPNIVQIHDFQLIDRRGSNIKAYMVMDYLEGGTLASYLHNTTRKGIFPRPNEMVDLFASISSALDYAHQTGMIHRDIKPANILLDRPVVAGKAIGEPILTDFGIARLQGTSTSTVTRAFLGTPLYISPEQAASEEVDRRSDLYSLGIVLYEMLAGVTPFQGDNPFTVMMKHIHEKPISPDSINPRISPALAAVMLQSIAKNPQERFPTAAAMTAALAQALNVPVPASLSSLYRGNSSSVSRPFLQAGNQQSSVPPALINTPTILNTPTSTNTFTMSSSFSVPPASGGIEDQEKTALSSRIREASYQTPPGRVYEPGIALPPQPVAAPLQPTRSRKTLFILLAALLLLSGTGASVLLLVKNAQNTNSTQNAANKVVGQIVFTRSANASAPIFDQLKIDLTDIAALPGGKAYYAWLIVLPNAEEKEPTDPSWALQMSNGAIHGTYASASPSTDLFAHSSKFLITEEDTNPAPIIPNTDLNMRKYYALLPSAPSSSPSPSFEVRQCPTGDTSDTCK